MLVKEALLKATEDTIEFCNQFMEEIDSPHEDWEAIKVVNHPRSHITEIFVNVPDLG